MRLKLYLSLLLCAATLLVFWQLGSHQFIIYDDPEYVTENPFVRMGLTRASIAWAFTSFHSANWHPLTWLSHMADVQLFGLDPSGHHITSLILHTTNVVLLFLLLCRLTGFPWRAMVVAALFAFHPLHVESVAWIAERKDVLCTLFFLVALYAYAGYVNSPGRGRYLLVVGAFIAGLMAKPMLVTLPFVLLLLDYWPLARMGLRSPPPLSGLRAEGRSCPKAGGGGGEGEAANCSTSGTLPLSPTLSHEGRGGFWILNLMAVRMGGEGAVSGKAEVAASESTRVPWRRLLLEKVPFLALSVISCMVTILAQNKVGAVKSLSSYPFSQRAANAVTTYADYLWKTIWPQKLAVFYPFSKPVSWSQLLVAASLLAALSLAAVWWRAQKPYLIFGWLWYLGILVPVIGLVQVGGQACADRYTYIPLIGIFIAVVWWLDDLCSGYRQARILPALLAALALAACIGTTLRQESYWRDDVALFSHALAVTDDNYVAHTNLGFVLVRQGRFLEASRHFNEAIRISPSLADPYLNQGDNLLRAGEFEQSIAFISKAIELRPDSAAAYNDMGVAMLRTGRLREAYDNFTAAIELDPLMADGYYNKGIVMSMLGKSDEAIVCYQKALQLNPDNPGCHAKLAIELVAKKRIQEAFDHFSEALRLNPGDGATRNRLEELSRQLR